jgi:hypothetical protein
VSALGRILGDELGELEFNTGRATRVAIGTISVRSWEQHHSACAREDWGQRWGGTQVALGPTLGAGAALGMCSVSCTRNTRPAASELHWEMHSRPLRLTLV